jgi:hypothetical protein
MGEHMIELAFGESSAGALKVAKSMKHGEKMCGSTAIIGDNGKKRRIENAVQFWTGESMEGNTGDVVALTLALDIGDISDMGAELASRKKVLDILFGDFPGVADEILKTNQHYGKFTTNRIMRKRPSIPLQNNTFFDFGLSRKELPSCKKCCAAGRCTGHTKQIKSAPFGALHGRYLLNRMCFCKGAEISIWEDVGLLVHRIICLACHSDDRGPKPMKRGH